MTNFEKQKVVDIMFHLMCGNTIFAQGKTWKLNSRNFMCYKDGDTYIEQPLWIHKYFALVADVGKDQWLQIKKSNKEYKQIEKARIKKLEALYS